MNFGYWHRQVFLAAVALAAIAVIAGIAGRVALATSGDAVQWKSEFSLSFSPTEVQRAGWEKQAESIATGLDLRLRARSASLTTGRQQRADGGAELRYVMEGKAGLDQFRGVMFDDAQAIGGMLGGPADMTLTGEVSADENLTLVLESNISTGYAWQVDRSQSRFVQPVGPDDYEAKGNMLGASGRQVVRIKGMGSGQAVVVLHYRRPWMPQEAPNRSYRVEATKLSAIADLSDPAPASAVPSAKGHTAPSDQALAPASLPSAWDWRSQGKVSPIRNQGSCGSCWAFSTMAAFESNMLINNQVADPGSDNFSEQYLISCNQSGWSCRGGYFAHDYNVSAYGLKNNPPGGVTEAAFPYSGSEVSCGTTYDHPEKLNAWYYVNSSVSVPSAADIKNAIYNRGPVSAAVCVGSAFNNYSGGVFSTDEKSACGGGVNHAILLVGWDDSTNSWIMKNSWGTYWGENGYMRIKYGTSNVGYRANYVIGTAGTPPACYTVTTGSIGSGTVNKNLSPNCNGGTGYTEGTTLALTAVPANGYAFTGWSGSATGTANPLNLTVDAAKSLTASFAPVNQLRNPNFELDADANNRPDRWTSSPKFLRSTDVVQDLAYSGRLKATDNRNVAISQAVNRIRANTAYRFSGYVNIPSTFDAFTFKVQLKWRDSLGYVLRSDTLATYSGATNGWVNVASNPTAPARAVSVLVKLAATNLNATVYVDNFYFGR